jgi:hypothetical protein
MQPVAGDEVDGFIEISGDFVGDDAEFEAMRRVGFTGGQAGKGAGGCRAFEKVSSSQLHYRCPLKSVSQGGEGWGIWQPVIGFGPPIEETLGRPPITL